MKLTSLTPGGVDFVYYLITDAKIKAKNINEDFLMFSQPLKSTRYFQGEAPTLTNLLVDDALLTRQDDLAETLKVNEGQLSSVRTALLQRLWLTKYQGHFDLADLGEDFVWEPTGSGRPKIDEVFGKLSDSYRKDAVTAYNKGMRNVKKVRFIASVFDTNEGYGKPTFINGIYIGDLAAIGGEGSDRWQDIEMELPHSVVHWLREQVTIKVENYGKEIPGKGRFSDAYNIKDVRIVVEYDDGSTWESKRFKETMCSVPQWKNCEGKKVRAWGDPVQFQF